jgi:hypothetical protein
MDFRSARPIALLAAVLCFALFAAAPSASFAQLFRRWCEPCVPCPTAPETGAATQPGTSAGTAAKEGPAQEAAPSPPEMPPADLFAQSGAGAASGPESAAPNMIGDFFGASGGQSRVLFPSYNVGGTLLYNDPFNGILLPSFGTLNGTGTLVLAESGSYNSQGQTIYVPSGSSWQISGKNLTSANSAELSAIQAAFPNTIVVFNGGAVGTSLGASDIYSPITTSYKVTPYASLFIPDPGSGGVVGRTKIADDTSPIPQDRIMFDYSFFDDVPLVPGGVNVHRFTPGFEKTFLDGMMSFEMQIPCAVTLDSSVVQDGGNDLSHGEFGDVALTLKSLLFQQDHLAIAGGLTLTVPTASDTNVILADGTPLVRIVNRSTHLAPFLGFLWTPNDRFFLQGFYQVDVEAGGCPVLVNLDGLGLQGIGTLHDTTYQYVDLGLGSWLYRGPARYGRLTGWAWTAELHGSDSFSPTSPVVADNWQIGDSNSFDSWNVTIGTHLEFKDRSVLTMAYVDPLGGGASRQFNGEFRLMFNYYFGASAPVRAPNM